MRAEILETRRLLAVAPTNADGSFETGVLDPVTMDHVPVIVAPYPTLNDQAQGRVGPDGSQGTFEPSPNTHLQTPDASGPGGMVDIGDPYAGDFTNGELPVDPAADRETREVLQMLSSLKYTPTPGDIETTAPPRDVAADGEDQLPGDTRARAATLPGDAAPERTTRRLTAGSTEAASLEDDDSGPEGASSRFDTRGEKSDRTEEPTVDAEGAAPSKDALPADRGEQSVRSLDEGGMVALFRAAPLDESAFASERSVPIESLPDVPVQMDSAYGKFQVFEVSTVEDELTPTADDTTARRPLSEAAVALIFASIVYASHAPRSGHKEDHAPIQSPRARQDV